MSLHESVTRSPSGDLNSAFTPLVELYVAGVDPAEVLERSRPYVVNPRTVRDVHEEAQAAVDNFPELFEIPEHELETSVNGFVVHAAVGEYGEEFTRQLIRTAAALIDGSFSAENLLARADDTRNEYGDTLARYTYYGKLLQNDLNSTGAVMHTFRDGLFTVLNAVNWLTMYRVEGYEDPRILLIDLVDQHTISHLALLTPPRLTGEMSGQGIVLKSPAIKVRESGRLQVNNRVIDNFVEGRANGFYKSNSGALEDLDIKGCPLGRRLKGNKESGIDMAARMFARCLTA